MLGHQASCPLLTTFSRDDFHGLSNDLRRFIFRVQVNIRKDKSDDYFRDAFLVRNQQHSDIESE